MIGGDLSDNPVCRDHFHYVQTFNRSGRNCVPAVIMLAVTIAADMRVRGPKINYPPEMESIGMLGDISAVLIKL
jgi:hypothetical protein